MFIFRDGFAWNRLFWETDSWVMAQGRKRAGETGGGKGKEEGWSEMYFLERRGGAEDLSLRRVRWEKREIEDFLMVGSVERFL